MSGCGCRSRTPRYPSDLTDEQRLLLEPEARAVMAELPKGPGGAPMSHDLRVMLDAIGYLTRYGVEWPADFLPWSAVYAFFELERAGAAGACGRPAAGSIRIACGRSELPTAAVIDAQTVRGADTVAAASVGYDAGKKTLDELDVASSCRNFLDGRVDSVPDGPDRKGNRHRQNSF